MSDYNFENFRAELAERGIQSNPLLERLWQEFIEIRIGSKRPWKIAGKILQDYIRKTPRMPAAAETGEELARKLAEDKKFFQTLYSNKPNKKYRILPLPMHEWSDRTVQFGATVFECPPGNPIGYADFRPNPKGIEISFQGHKSADIPSANKILGKQWYDVFMGRILQAHRPLVESGVKLELHVPPKFRVEPRFRQTVSTNMRDNMDLPRKIRNKYFSATGQGGNHPLNPNRKRVQAILRPR